MRTLEVRYTTRELSMRTIDDFEHFFAQVHGCACTLYLFGRHLSPVTGTAAERAERIGTPDRSARHFPLQDLRRRREAAAVRELVRRGQAHGILVYADREPVGWCHFGRVDELPVPSEESNPDMIYARDPSTDWVITCFVTRRDHRRRGVAGRALGAAVSAIEKRGGGWIEGVPMAFPHDDPELRRLRRTYRWRSPEVATYLRDQWPSRVLPAVGPVSGCLVSAQTLDHAGTMSMYERAGFTPVRRDEHRSADDLYHRGDFVVMHRHV